LRLPSGLGVGSLVPVASVASVGFVLGFCVLVEVEVIVVGVVVVAVVEVVVVSVVVVVVVVVVGFGVVIIFGSILSDVDLLPLKVPSTATLLILAKKELLREYV